MRWYTTGCGRSSTSAGLGPARRDVHTSPCGAWRVLRHRTRVTKVTPRSVSTAVRISHRVPAGRYRDVHTDSSSRTNPRQSTTPTGSRATTGSGRPWASCCSPWGTGATGRYWRSRSHITHVPCCRWRVHSGGPQPRPGPYPQGSPDEGCSPDSFRYRVFTDETSTSEGDGDPDPDDWGPGRSGAGERDGGCDGGPPYLSPHCDRLQTTMYRDELLTLEQRSYCQGATAVLSEQMLPF